PASIINETTNSRSILFNTPVPTGEITFLPVEQVVNNNEQLNQLLFGMNPYITINTEGVGQNSHETPVVAYCHNNAINSLYSGNESFKEVKVLRIYVDGAAYSDLDISQLENFDNLEYIVISFTYDACGNMSDSCLLTRTQNMIKAGNKPVTVLYQLSILQ
ncbi:hypothetical protein LJC25_03020, partial [Bacteroidales bacterium OttesenSCG-928-K03]|nr:hypothetical protein [Bacteroidales bacterium OttesenSCG-928-K03]